MGIHSPGMLIAQTGTALGGDAAVVGLAFVGSVFATVKAAVTGRRALRAGLDWAGVRVAALWLLVPYAIALLLGGPEGVLFTLRVAFDGTYLGHFWATPPLVVAVVLACGVLVRLRERRVGKAS